VCYSSRKWPETDVFCEVIKFKTFGPEDLPWWCHALNYGRYVEEGPLEWRNVSFCPPEWLTVILGWKGNEMARKRHGTCTLLPKNQWKPHKMWSTRIWKNSGGFKKLTRVPKIVCNSSRKWPETDVFLWCHKIRNRLARKPTLVVLCLKLWSVRGGGTVRVTKRVILSSGMVGSNSRLERQRNGP
jgi:hypothetical protein